MLTQAALGVKLNRYLVTVLLILVSYELSACQTPNQPVLTAVVGSPTDTNATAVASLPVEVTPLASVAPQVLRIWLPPEFDPALPEPAGILMQAQLTAFTAAHPDVYIETRPKRLSGAGGMLDSLRAARDAAPNALPDLLVLNSYGLRQAAAALLVAPLDNLFTATERSDYFSYALQSAQIDPSLFGVPIGSDFLVAAAPSGSYASQSILTWKTILDNERPMAFAGNDPTASTIWHLYQAAGGTYTLNTDGHLQIQRQPLRDVFAFLEALQSQELLSPRSSSINSTNLVWSMQPELPQALLLTDLSSILPDPLFAQTQIWQIPSPGNKSVTLAKTWHFAIVNQTTQNNDRLRLVWELVKWLENAEYQTEWLYQAGLLPARLSILERLPQPAQTIGKQLTAVASPHPPAEALNDFGVAVQGVLSKLLSQQISAEQATQQVLIYLSEQ